MITADQIETWLRGIAAGVIDLTRDNESMAQATLQALRDHADPDKPLPADHLSEHFTLAEFTHSDTATAYGIDNTPTPEALDQLHETAALLEEVRAICGNQAVTISSGYRCPQLNSMIGGAANSAHLYGCAADFTIPAFGSPLEICRKLESRMDELAIDQLIYENASWVHIGRAIPPNTVPRYMALTINGGSTVHGFVA
jgi:zinc D-Ala-D-Ala carboxypeptidase